MRYKHLIIFSLFLAYSLLLVHSVIPHHHHDTPQEAEHHHHSEHTDHHHDDGKESEEHGHTPHFVHSADFGNYILNPSVSFPDFSKIHSDLLFVFTDLFVIKDEFSNIKRSSPPDCSPPLSSGLYSTFSLRGPPHFISMA
ncbi:MAG: hypothetical protein DWQ44_01435 [Bacteroidetes bacterium]|jgi:hypothetical protein|nr:MAG: hypothetical protein DWQ39_05325 [Bacteroidota bacterium]REK36117.1 MAG: hypothetical protein DWQ44_01435 [Bacteroidota bacterium]REK51512.1 MAG: hypothetical protein DWQ48_01400 [Bacteroidota bacterium]